MGYDWDFTPVVQNAGLLLEGLWGTLAITAAALAFGLPLGFGGALLRLSGRPVPSAIGRFYVTLFRSTPPLVLLFWAFYALPLLIGVRMTPFMAAAATLAMQSGAFFAEVFRGGIVSIERGQWEAGRALGMGSATLMRRIVLPQAIRRMIPAFLDRLVELLKTTSLVSAIAYADLLYQAITLSASTFRPLEIFTAVAAIYFLVLFSISLLVRRVEARLLARQ